MPRYSVDGVLFDADHELSDDELWALKKEVAGNQQAAPSATSLRDPNPLVRIGQGTARGLMDRLGLLASAPGALMKAGSAIKNDPMGAMNTAGAMAKQLPGAVVNYATSRYGSPSKALNTALDDPIGLMEDVALPLRAVGAVGKLPAMAQMGSAIDPAMIAGKGVSGAIRGTGKFMEHRAKGAATSALKIPNSLRNANPNNDIVQDFLELTPPGSPKGTKPRPLSVSGELDRIKDIKDSENRVSSIIAGSKKTTTAPEILRKQPAELVKNLANVERWNPEALPAAKDVFKQFYDRSVKDVPKTVTTQAPSTLMPGQTYPVQKTVVSKKPVQIPVQNVWQGVKELNHELANKFGKSDITSGKIRGQQALRVAARDKLSELEPAVVPERTFQSRAIPVSDAVSNRLDVFGRQQMLPTRAAFAMPILSPFGASVPQKLLAALVGGGIDNPLVLGHAAQSTHRTAQKIKKVSGLPAAVSRAGTPMSLLARLMSSHEQP